MRFVGIALLACAACGFPKPPDVSDDAGPSPEKDAGSDATDADLGIDAGRSRCANVGYAALPWPATGVKPQAVASADLNGDTKPDLVAVNEIDSTVSVLLGNADGTFHAKVDYATGPTPEAVAVADVNGDAKPDLVVGNSGTSQGASMSVLLGNGDGTFGSKLDYPTTSFTQAIVVADVSGDGKPDALVASTGAVSVLLNNGNGTFALKVDYTTGQLAPRSIAVGDISGDGKLDIVLAVSGDDGNAVSVLLGNGNGTFATHVDRAFSGNFSLFGVAIGDVNGDGKSDVATGDTGTNTVSILLGNGAGSFTSRVDSQLASSPRSLAFADVNEDGKLDLVVRGSELTVMLGQGDGRFTADATYPIETSGFGGFTSSQSLVLTDLNRDGKRDVVVTGRNKLNVLLGNGAGKLRSHGEIPGGTTSRNLVIADANHDGKPDAILSNSGSTSVSVLAGNGDGTFAARVDVDIGSTPSSLVASDLDRDGNVDLVVANSRDAISILRGSSEGSFGGRTDYTAGPVNSVIAADMNNDSKLDIVISVSTVPLNDGEGGQILGSVAILMGNGDGTFAAKADYLAGISPASVRSADLNADGNMDLVVANSDNGKAIVLLGNGTASSPARVDYVVGAPLRSVVIADVNHDGNSDMIGFNDSITILNGNGDGTFASRLGTSLSLSPAAIADVSGDSNLDLVAFDGGQTVNVFAGNGDGTFRSAISYPVGAGPAAVAVSDLNRDGQPDLLVDSSLGTSITVLLGTCVP